MKIRLLKGKVIFLISLFIISGYIVPHTHYILPNDQIHFILKNPITQLIIINKILQNEKKASVLLSKSNQKDPPSDGPVIISDNPYVEFNFNYKNNFVTMEITIRNTLENSLKLFDLPIKIKKEDPFAEFVDLDECYIDIEHSFLIEETGNLNLSTFDHYEEIFFYIKLIEGKEISVNEEYRIKLKWYDFFGSKAIYDETEESDIISNLIYSINDESYQPFPFVERIFTQEYLNEEELLLYYKVDFRVTNLMEHELSNFSLNYLKFKNELGEETFNSFQIISQGSTPIDFIFYYNYDNEKINCTFELNSSKIGNILAPEESVTLRVVWIGYQIRSNITLDAVRWISPEIEGYYDIIYLNTPYFPLMTPVEHCATTDFDNDVISNEIEFKKPSLDPYYPQSWINWEKMRNESYIQGSNITIPGHYNNFVKYLAKAKIYIAPQTDPKDLNLVVTELGNKDEIINFSVNGEYKIESITPQDINNNYKLASNITNDFIDINFTIKHQGTDNDINYKMGFYLDNFPLLDITECFNPDYDGDGIKDDIEINGDTSYNIFDTDGDWLGDSSDLSPNRTINYEIGNTPKIVFPVLNNDPNAQVIISIQIQPTIVDHTDHIPFGNEGNEMYIYPSLRIFGLEYGGDFLPDNCFSANDKIGILELSKGPNPVYGFPITWTALLNYSSINQAKTDKNITLKFDLVWVISERKPSGESNIVHIYERNQNLTIQGIQLSEYDSIKIAVGAINDGSDYLKTVVYAKAIANILLYETSTTLSDIPGIVYLETRNINDLGKFEKEKEFLKENITTKINQDLGPSEKKEINETSFIIIKSFYKGSYEFGDLINFRGLSNLDCKLEYTEWINFYTNPVNSFLGYVLIETELEKQQSDFIGLDIFSNRSFDGESVIESIDSSQIEIYSYSGPSVKDIIKIIKIYLFIHKIINICFKIGEILEKGNEIITNNLDVKKNPFYQLLQFQLAEHAKNQKIFDIAWNLPAKLFNLVTKIYKIKQIIRVFQLAVFWKREIEIGTTIGQYMSKKIADVFKVGALAKVSAVVSFISGAISIISGLENWAKGQLATGMTEGVNAILSIITGILILFPNPITYAAALILAGWQFLTWALDEFFGIDLYEAFFNLLGFINAKPQGKSWYDIKYNKTKIEMQHGFRVGDSIGLEFSVLNYGNTLLLSTLDVKAGPHGSWAGTKASSIFIPGQIKKLTVYDTFENETISPSLSYRYTINWGMYYPGIGFYVCFLFWCGWIWLIPPQWFLGNLEWADQTIPLTNWIVCPSDIEGFKTWMYSPQFAPPPKPTIQMIDEKIKINPKIENFAQFKINLTNPSEMDIKYNVTVETAEFASLNLDTDEEFEKWIEVEVPAGSQCIIPLDIYIPSESLIPAGNYSVKVCAIPDVPVLEPLVVRSDFEIEPIYDFETFLSPEIPETIDIEPGQVILHNITIKNVGNAIDTYDIEIENLTDDYYILIDHINCTGYDKEIVEIPENDYNFSGTINTTETINASGTSPGLIAPLQNKTVYLLLIPPRHYTTLPEAIDFTIRITSKNDSSVFKEYYSTLNITNYYDADFNIIPEQQITNPGYTATNYFKVTNLGNIDDTYSFSISSLDFKDAYEAYPTAIPEEWISTNATELSIPLGQNKSIEISTQIPADWEGYDDTTYDLNISSSSINEPLVNFSKIINITVNATSESKIRYILRELDQFKDKISDMFSGELANQLLIYINKSINKTKDALDSLLIEEYIQTISNLSRAELELRYLENVIRVKIISGNIIEEIGLELINSLRHIRDHIILTPSFLVNSVTGKPEASELGEINLEIAHIIDSIKDSLDDDNTGLEFTRCWDNVSDYLPLAYTLAITLNLYNAEDKIYSTLINILNNDTVASVKSISVSKFYLKISIMTLRYFGFHDLINASVADSAIKSTRIQRDRLTLITGTLIGTNHTIRLSQLEVQIANIADNITDSVLGTTTIEVTERTSNGTISTFIVTLFSSLAVTHLESAAWSINRAMLYIVENDNESALCSVKSALWKLDTAKDVIDWLVDIEQINPDYGTEITNQIQNVTNELEVIETELRESLPEPEHWLIEFIRKIFDFLSWLVEAIFG